MLKDNSFIVGYVVFSEREDHYRVEQVSPRHLRGMACDMQKVVRSRSVIHRTEKLANGMPDTSKTISNTEWLA